MDMSEKARKAREHTRKRYKPTGGWAMRAKQRIPYGDLSRASGPGRSVMGPFRSHVILGVMPEDLSIVQVKEKEKEQSKQGNIIFNQTKDGQIVTRSLVGETRHQRSYSPFLACASTRGRSLRALPHIGQVIS